MAALKLLGISGSIRKASFNTIVLSSLGERLGDSLQLQLFPLNEMPLYNQDLDGDHSPPAVVQLRQAIREADGVIISSPEYNYGMSGVLKNALDWVSRPYGKSPLTGKPVLTMTVSPAYTGGARAQAQLNETLTSIAARIVLRPQTVIGDAFEKISDGKLVHEETISFLRNAVNDLVRDIRSRASVTVQES